ncbi:MAG: site-2 protease family protein [Caldisericaceae bacterium]|nr:site-2 protease family protein [Caldisericaceae bacterium]
MFEFSADYWIKLLLFTLPAVLIVLTLHEVGHAYSAYKLGDPTAKRMGRLSLNPLRHIDPVGMITLILFRFGWGKPVPVDFFALRNLRSGMVIVSLAGPVMNFITALILSPIYKWAVNSPIMLTSFSYIVILLQYIIVYSIFLGMFNLIPIPPLDGSKVLFAFTKRPQRYLLDESINLYGMFLLIILIFLRVPFNLLNKIILPVINLLL